jgi:hypothetical protein
MHDRVNQLYHHLQGTCCVYCGQRANSRDHVQARSHVASLLDLVKFHGLTTVPSCMECNALAGAKVFPTLGAKRRYIQRVLRKRYQKVLKMPDWTEQELEKIECPSLKATIREGLRMKMLVRKRVSWRNVVSVEEDSPKCVSGKSSVPRAARLRSTRRRPLPPVERGESGDWRDAVMEHMETAFADVAPAWLD